MIPPSSLLQRRGDGEGVLVGGLGRLAEDQPGLPRPAARSTSTVASRSPLATASSGLPSRYSVSVPTYSGKHLELTALQRRQVGLALADGLHRRVEAGVVQRVGVDVGQDLALGEAGGPDDDRRRCPDDAGAEVVLLDVGRRDVGRRSAARRPRRRSCSTRSSVVSTAETVLSASRIAGLACGRRRSPRAGMTLSTACSSLSSSRTTSWSPAIGAQVSPEASPAAAAAAAGAGGAGLTAGGGGQQQRRGARGVSDAGAQCAWRPPSVSRAPGRGGDACLAGGSRERTLQPARPRRCANRAGAAVADPLCAGAGPPRQRRRRPRPATGAGSPAVRPVAGRARPAPVKGSCFWPGVTTQPTHGQQRPR